MLAEINGLLIQSERALTATPACPTPWYKHRSTPGAYTGYG